MPNISHKYLQCPSVASFDRADDGYCRAPSCSNESYKFQSSPEFIASIQPTLDVMGDCLWE
jgi:hypothetical protein